MWCWRCCGASRKLAPHWKPPFRSIQKGHLIGRLEPLSWADAERPETAPILAKWRETANPFFPSQFPVTLEGTQRWLVKGVLETHRPHPVLGQDA